MSQIEKGTTDVTRYVILRDSADGTPETGYTITSLDLQYTRSGAAPAAKVDATALSTTSDAHSDNTAIQVDATSSPGLYRVDWPDAAFATGADKVVLCVSGTGLDPAYEEIDLVNAGVLAPSNVLFVDFGGVPSVLVTPKTGTDTFDMRFESRDHNNQLVAPDSVTVTLVDQDGTDLSSRLDDTTPSAVSTGLYEIVYTATAGQAAAQLKLGVTLTKSGYVGDKQHYSINLVDAAALVNANVTQVNGTSQTAYDIGGNLGAPVGEESISAMILSNTGIGQSIEADTQDIQSRLPAALGANGNIKADVRDYNGTAGTFASGRPEANLSADHLSKVTGYAAVTWIATSDNAKTIIEAASAGTLCILAAGENTNVSSTIAVPAGVHITGIGYGVSRITSSSGNCFEILSGTKISNLRCNGIHTSTGSQSDIQIYDVYSHGGIDGLLIQGTTKRVHVKGGYFFSGWDGIAMLNPSVEDVLIEDCFIGADGSQTNSLAITAGIKTESGSNRVVIRNVTIDLDNTGYNNLEAVGIIGGGDTTVENATIYVYNATGFAEGVKSSVGRLSIVNSTIRVNAASAYYALQSTSTGTIVHHGCNFDTSLVSGSGVKAAAIDVANILNPTTTINLSGTTIKTATDVETDTNEMQGDLADGGRLDLILDATLADTADIQPKIGTPSVTLAADIAAGAGLDAAGIRTAIGMASADLDTQLDALSPATETRDLTIASKPNQWDMVQRAGGVISLNPITIYQGETKKLSFNLSKIIGSGDVIATMGTPTASNVKLTPTKLGIGPTWANLTLAAAADTTAGTGYTVRVTVTTDEGDGPILLIGNVTVLDD